MTFRAQFAGQCRGCGRRIVQGEMIEYRDNEVAHADCDASAARESLLHSKAAEDRREERRLKRQARRRQS